MNRVTDKGVGMVVRQSKALRVLELRGTSATRATLGEVVRQRGVGLGAPPPPSPHVQIVPLHGWSPHALRLAFPPRRPRFLRAQQRRHGEGMRTLVLSRTPAATDIQEGTAKELMEELAADRPLLRVVF